MCDGSRSSWWFDWDYATEEFPVTQGCTAGAIDSDHVLVELSDLRYHSSPIPFEGVVADLVLNSNSITYFQCWQAFDTCGPAFFSFNMSDAQSFFTFIKCVLPRWVWLVATR